MQLVPEHQVFVDIQDILPTRQIDGSLQFVHGLVVVYAVEHLITEPGLRLLAVKAFGNVKQYVTTRTTHGAVDHVDTQLALATHQLTGIDLREVRTTVQIDDSLTGVHGLTLVALIALSEMRMGRVKGVTQLHLSLLRLILILGQLTPLVLLQNVGQLTANPARLVHSLIETLDRGGHGLGFANVVS